MAERSRWGDIYEHLQSKGFAVYSPGQHKGECTSKYIVLKTSTKTRIAGLSSVRQLYDLMIYIPVDEYSQLEPFVNDVEAAMKELQPMIMPVYYQAASYYDSGVKGHMVSLQYRNNRKI